MVRIGICVVHFCIVEQDGNGITAGGNAAYSVVETRSMETVGPVSDRFGADAGGWASFLDDDHLSGITLRQHPNQQQ